MKLIMFLLAILLFSGCQIKQDTNITTSLPKATDTSKKISSPLPTQANTIVQKSFDTFTINSQNTKVKYNAFEIDPPNGWEVTLQQVPAKGNAFSKEAFSEEIVTINKNANRVIIRRSASGGKVCTPKQQDFLHIDSFNWRITNNPSGYTLDKFVVCEQHEGTNYITSTSIGIIEIITPSSSVQDLDTEVIGLLKSIQIK